MEYGLLNLPSKTNILGDLEAVAGKLGRKDLAKNHAEAKAHVERRIAELSQSAAKKKSRILNVKRESSRNVYFSIKLTRRSNSNLTVDGDELRPSICCDTFGALQRGTNQ